MAYTAFEWSDGEQGGTPITAARLNALENALEEAHEAIELLESMLDSSSG